MYAIVILSLGATWPGPPSTCLGTMVNAAAPAAAEARNLRRLMSSLGAMVIFSLGNRSRGCVEFRFDFARRIWYSESPRLAASDAGTLPPHPKHGSRRDRRILPSDYRRAGSRASPPARSGTCVRIAAVLLLSSSTAIAQSTALVGATVIDGTGKA